jgi:hypothetical protein
MSPPSRIAVSRRQIVQRTAALLALISPPLALRAAGGTGPGAPAAPVVEVWKSPTCGCCKAWMAHLEREGFRVTAYETGNTAARSRLGIPTRLGSCHTALVQGYAIEGHVPAADIRRLLRERPAAVGLAVPGMPLGSPGMDGPAYGNRTEPYEVLLVARDGSTQVFNRYFQPAPRSGARTG